MKQNTVRMLLLQSKSQNLLREINAKTPLPVFLQESTTKGVFFTELRTIANLEEKFINYLGQYGIYFLGQVLVLPDTEIKTFQYAEVKDFLIHTKRHFPEKHAVLFAAFAEKYRQVKIQAVFSLYEIKILSTEVWGLLDESFPDLYNEYMLFGDSHYRPLIRMLSSANYKHIRIEYRKLHLLKFFDWINKNLAVV
jgi:hypothetical protein